MKIWILFCTMTLVLCACNNNREDIDPQTPVNLQSAPPRDTPTPTPLPTPDAQNITPAASEVNE